MTKLHLLSDLHTECSDFDPPLVNADVIVLAGDIGVGTKGLDWAAKHMAPGRAFHAKPVIYVHGNHELYSGDWNETPKNLRARAQDLGIHYLDCDELVLGDTRFLGCTLWTDYRLFSDFPAAMAAGQLYMADYRAIRIGHNFLKPLSTMSRHEAHREWLEGKLREPFSGKTVVVTHMLPSLRSVALRYKGDLTSAAFASDLERLVPLADAWFHGHTHDSFDYEIGGCRVVCNPRGYVSHRRPQPENGHFDPELVLNI